MTLTHRRPSALKHETLFSESEQVLSYAGLEHLVGVEGLRLIAYRDVAGYWTIGVGHLLTDVELASERILIGNESVAWKVRGLTEAQAYQLLDQDADWAERAVSCYVTAPLTQPQFDSLVSFVFNVGPENFRSSTLLRRVNAERYSDVPAQMRLWVYSGGKKWTGLVNRRESEAALWMTT